jgi:hypothetical protein
MVVPLLLVVPGIIEEHISDLGAAKSPKPNSRQPTHESASIDKSCGQNWGFSHRWVRLEAASVTYQSLSSYMRGILCHFDCNKLSH